MFYNISLDHLSQVRISEIKTHSFVAKEAQLLQYVHEIKQVLRTVVATLHVSVGSPAGIAPAGHLDVKGCG